MKKTKTFNVKLIKTIEKEIEIKAPANIEMNEIDDWVDWHADRIFDVVGKISSKCVEFPEEIINQKYVSISAELSSSDEYVDYTKIFELKRAGK